MRTQVFYHEWSLRSGRVVCTDSALELRFSRVDPNTWVDGVWATKVIPYDTIQAGFTVGQFVRVVFDGDDEIMFHRRVFERCPSGLPPFVTLLGSYEVPVGWVGEAESVQAVVEGMRARQRVLPPVSWAEGRHSASPRSWKCVRALQVIPPLAGVGWLTWSLVR